MLANDLETARFNMVEQQIRPAEVIDPRVLNALQTVPRERFVGDEYQGLAFADVALPIGEGQQMMKPVQEAHLLQALNVQAGESVLEIGTGSGFITACLAHLGGVVTSYETQATLSESRGGALGCAGGKERRTGRRRWPACQSGTQSFKVIAVTGSLPTYPSFSKTCWHRVVGCSW